MNDDKEWKAYADGVSSSNLSKALNRGNAKTSRAVLQQVPEPAQKQQPSPQKDAGKNSDPDVAKTK